jgi:hypothetical protein
VARLLRWTLPSLAVLAVVAPAPAQAASGFCSPTGDYCYSVGPVKGVVRLKLATFSFQGSVRVCVTAPDASRSCKPFRLRESRGVFSVDARWSAHFPRKGAGTYRVSFTGPSSSTLFKPSVTFRLRG